MTEATPLDIAHAAMMADESDDAARLRFYERMADVELFLLLEDEPDADQVSPVLLEDAYVLVFDRIERLMSGSLRPMWHCRGARLRGCWMANRLAWR